MDKRTKIIGAAVIGVSLLAVIIGGMHFFGNNAEDENTNGDGPANPTPPANYNPPATGDHEHRHDPPATKPGWTLDNAPGIPDALKGKRVLNFEEWIAEANYTHPGQVEVRRLGNHFTVVDWGNFPGNPDKNAQVPQGACALDGAPGVVNRLSGLVFADCNELKAGLGYAFGKDFAVRELGAGTTRWHVWIESIPPHTVSPPSGGGTPPAGIVIQQGAGQSWTISPQGAGVTGTVSISGQSGQVTLTCSTPSSGTVKLFKSGDYQNSANGANGGWTITSSSQSLSGVGPGFQFWFSQSGMSVTCSWSNPSGGGTPSSITITQTSGQSWTISPQGAGVTGTISIQGQSGQVTLTCSTPSSGTVKLFKSGDYQNSANGANGGWTITSSSQSLSGVGPGFQFWFSQSGMSVTCTWS